MTVLAVTAAVAFTAGYLTCRHRPGDRICEWAMWLIVAPDNPAWRHARWWIGQAILATEGLLLLAVRPRRTWQRIRDNRTRAVEAVNVTGEIL